MQSPGLPVHLTSFVGRDEELSSVQELLADNRLVTVTGTGGTGKTRLATTVASVAAADFDDGLLFVELAPVSDGSLVSIAVASALSVRVPPTRGVLDAMCDEIGDRALLLVLDNCEHVLDSAAALCAGLIERCPRVRILTTSRERLRVPWEQVFPLAPLDAPGAGESLRTDTLPRFPAVRLFAERASAADPTFVIDDDNAAAVAEICAGVEGLPLAIELAAARARFMTVQEIAERLRNPLDVLGGGPRTVTPRQQTLRGAIDWSYQLLADDERALFRTVSLFPAGFTLDAAEQVWQAPAMDALARLVDHSLVIADRSLGSRTRYRMLEPVRAFARERLDSEEPGPKPHQRHRDWCVALIEARPSMPHTKWLEGVATEIDNIRAALDWCEHNEPGSHQHLVLVWGLSQFWAPRGLAAEGLVRIHTALRAAPKEPSAAAAATWLAASSLHDLSEEFAEARTGNELARDMYLELGDHAAAGVPLHNLASLAFRRGDYEEAAGLEREALGLLEQAGNRLAMAGAYIGLGNCAYATGDLTGAEAQYRHALAVFRELDRPAEAAVTLHNLGAILSMGPDGSGAEAAYGEALEIRRRIGDKPGTLTTLVNIGILARKRGLTQRSVDVHREALDLAVQLNNRTNLATVLESLACVAAEASEWTRAAALIGSAESIRAEVRESRSAHRDTDLERAAERTRVALGDPSFEEARTWGSNLTLADAAAFARTEGAAQTSSSARVVVLRREGDVWAVGSPDAPFRLRDTKGLQYLHRLIAAAGREIHVLELVSPGAGGIDRGAVSAGPVLDDQAKAVYRARIAELDAEVAEADEFNDPGRAERARDEREALMRQIASAVGLGGRDRMTVSPSERARQTVTKAIRSAILKINDQAPDLGGYLSQTVETGVFCRHVPPDPDPVAWQL